MDAEKEVRRRKAIAYILRRRKRARKPGANSGEVVKSVNRRIRGHLVFKPSGYAERSWWRIVPLMGGILVSLFPFFILQFLQVAPNSFEENNHLIGLLLIVCLIAVTIAIFAFFVAYMVRSIWRLARSHLPHKNE